MPTKKKLTILTKLTWTAEYRLKQNKHNQGKDCSLP